MQEIKDHSVATSPKNTYVGGRDREGRRMGFGLSIASNGCFYIGDRMDDKKEGRGVFYGTGGDLTEGQWVGDECSGVAVVTEPNGKQYFGHMIKGRREGSGRTVLPGEEFVGQFKQGKRQGPGLLRKKGASGETIVRADYVDGVMSGFASIKMPEKQYIYSGGVCNGKMHGLAEEVTSEAVYIGQFFKSKRYGLGYVRCKSGLAYIGSWRDGLRSGFGIEQLSNGEYYEGDFDQDNKNGACKWWNPDAGWLLTGEVEKGVPHGFGHLQWPGGAYYVGFWNRGARDGLGYQKTSDGRVYFGYWSNDKRHGLGYAFDPLTEFKGNFAEGLPHGKAVVRLGGKTPLSVIFSKGELQSIINEPAVTTMKLFDSLKYDDFELEASARLNNLEEYLDKGTEEATRKYYSFDFDFRLKEQELNSKIEQTIGELMMIGRAISDIRRYIRDQTANSPHNLAAALKAHKERLRSQKSHTEAAENSPSPVKLDSSFQAQPKFDSKLDNSGILNKTNSSNKAQDVFERLNEYHQEKDVTNDFEKISQALKEDAETIHKFEEVPLSRRSVTSRQRGNRDTGSQQTPSQEQGHKSVSFAAGMNSKGDSQFSEELPEEQAHMHEDPPAMRARMVSEGSKLLEARRIQKIGSTVELESIQSARAAPVSNFTDRTDSQYSAAEKEDSKQQVFVELAPISARSASEKKSNSPSVEELPPKILSPIEVVATTEEAALDAEFAQVRQGISATPEPSSSDAAQLLMLPDEQQSVLPGRSEFNESKMMQLRDQTVREGSLELNIGAEGSIKGEHSNIQDMSDIAAMIHQGRDEKAGLDSGISPRFQGEVQQRNVVEEVYLVQDDAENAKQTVEAVCTQETRNSQNEAKIEKQSAKSNVSSRSNRTSAVFSQVNDFLDGIYSHTKQEQFDTPKQHQVFTMTKQGIASEIQAEVQATVPQNRDSRADKEPINEKVESSRSHKILKDNPVPEHPRSEKSANESFADRYVNALYGRAASVSSSGYQSEVIMNQTPVRTLPQQFQSTSGKNAPNLGQKLSTPKELSVHQDQKLEQMESEGLLSDRTSMIAEDLLPFLKSIYMIPFNVPSAALSSRNSIPDQDAASKHEKKYASVELVTTQNIDIKTQAAPVKVTQEPSVKDQSSQRAKSKASDLNVGKEADSDATSSLASDIKGFLTQIYPKDPQTSSEKQSQHQPQTTKHTPETPAQIPAIPTPTPEPQTSAPPVVPPAQSTTTSVLAHDIKHFLDPLYSQSIPTEESSQTLSLPKQHQQANPQTGVLPVHQDVLPFVPPPVKQTQPLVYDDGVSLISDTEILKVMGPERIEVLGNLQIGRGEDAPTPRSQHDSVKNLSIIKESGHLKEQESNQGDETILHQAKSVVTVSDARFAPNEIYAAVETGKYERTNTRERNDAMSIATEVDVCLPPRHLDSTKEEMTKVDQSRLQRNASETNLPEPGVIPQNNDKQPDQETQDNPTELLRKPTIATVSQIDCPPYYLTSEVETHDAARLLPKERAHSIATVSELGVAPRNLTTELDSAIQNQVIRNERKQSEETVTEIGISPQDLNSHTEQAKKVAAPLPERKESLNTIPEFTVPPQNLSMQIDIGTQQAVVEAQRKVSDETRSDLGVQPRFGHAETDAHIIRAERERAASMVTVSEYMHIPVHGESHTEISVKKQVDLPGATNFSRQQTTKTVSACDVSPITGEVQLDQNTVTNNRKSDLSLKTVTEANIEALQGEAELQQWQVDRPAETSSEELDYGRERSSMIKTGLHANFSPLEAVETSDVLVERVLQQLNERTRADAGVSSKTKSEVGVTEETKLTSKLPK